MTKMTEKTLNIRLNLKLVKIYVKMSLSNTASNFFQFIQAFGNKLKLCNSVNIWMVEDRAQNLDSVTCGNFSTVLL